MVKLKTLALASMLFAGAAMAAPNIELSNNNSGTAGTAAPITMTFQGDGVVAGFDFVYAYDDTQFTVGLNCATSIPTSGTQDASVSCSVVGNTIKVLISPPFSFPVPTVVTGPVDLGFVNFASNVSTPPGLYNFPILEENYFDIEANAVVSTPSQDGALTVLELPPVPINGDANDDGVVNQADIPFVLDEYFEVALAPGLPDCNLDGNVNSGDVICITNTSLGG